MACHGGCRTPDIFVKCGSIYTVLISPLFSKMAAKQQFRNLDL